MLRKEFLCRTKISPFVIVIPISPPKLHLVVNELVFPFSCQLPLLVIIHFNLQLFFALAILVIIIRPFHLMSFVVIHIINRAFLFPFIVIYLRTFKCHRDEISGRIIFTPLTKPFSLQACAIGLTGERNYSAIAIIGVKCLFRINPFPFFFIAVFNLFNEQARFVIG